MLNEMNEDDKHVLCRDFFQRDVLVTYLVLKSGLMQLKLKYFIRIYQKNWFDAIAF